MTRNVAQRILFALALAVAVTALSSCQQEQSDAPAGDDYFGNGFKDLTTVVARVGDVEITEQDVDMRYRELPKEMQTRFTGDGWRRRLVRFMVDELLLAQGAVENKLYLESDVAQQLISMRRSTLIDAYKQFMLFEGLEPTEDEIREYYEHFKHNYVAEGALHARHVQCLDRASAYEAYEALQGTGREAAFPYVVSQYSRNVQTAADGGDLGWFNRGRFVRHVRNGALFSETVWGWEIGLHEPVEIEGEWHVVEILERRNPRQLGLSEVRGRIVQDLLPSLQREVQDAHTAELRSLAAIEYFGEYAPGQGRSAQELFQYAVMNNDPETQIELFELILEEFPDDDYAGKSLFMLANVYIDNWGDTRRARSFLNRLVDEYPDNELRDQGEYMLENLTTTNFQAPRSIRELQDLTR